MKKQYQYVTLGPIGSYSFVATKGYSKLEEPEIVSVNTISDAIDAVVKENADRAVIPYENSMYGSVFETIDGIFSNKLVIVDEIICDIQHSLIVLDSDVSLNDIVTIYSHPQAIGQCREFIRKYLSHANIVPTSSTAAAADIIAREKSKNCAAIASDVAAQQFGLYVSHQNIQSTQNNQTRFVVVSRPKPAQETSAPFTLCALSPHVDRPGLLHDILGIFQKHAVNLTQIESRPDKITLGSYIFFVRLAMRPDDLVFATIRKDLEDRGVAVQEMST